MSTRCRCSGPPTCTQWQSIISVNKLNLDCKQNSLHSFSWQLILLSMDIDIQSFGVNWIVSLSPQSVLFELIEGSVDISWTLLRTWTQCTPSSSNLFWDQYFRKLESYPPFSPSPPNLFTVANPTCCQIKSKPPACCTFFFVIIWIQLLKAQFLLWILVAALKSGGWTKESCNMTVLN